MAIDHPAVLYTVYIQIRVIRQTAGVLRLDRIRNADFRGIDMVVESVGFGEEMAAELEAKIRGDNSRVTIKYTVARLQRHALKKDREGDGCITLNNITLLIKLHLFLLVVNKLVAVNRATSLVGDKPHDD